MFLHKGISIVELRLSQVESSTRLEVSFHYLQFLSKVLHGLDIAIPILLKRSQQLVRLADGMRRVHRYGSTVKFLPFFDTFLNLTQLVICSRPVKWNPCLEP